MVAPPAAPATRRTIPATQATGAGGPGLTVLPELPSVVRGHVSHTRRSPLSHAFRYAAYLWLVDVDDLPCPPWYLRPFSGFKAADHLGDPRLSLRANVLNLLALNDIETSDVARVVMLANARVLGHVFDPLTVFWCLTEAGETRCVVAEVHNTYGERHVYLLHPDEQGCARAVKALHVSPFNDLAGHYLLRFRLTPTEVSTTVTLVRDGAAAFSAAFRGVPSHASTGTTMRTVLRRPLMPQRVSALIRIHGIALWLRGLPLVPRTEHLDQEGV